MVTRVWGKADSFELVFSPSRDGQWHANVPADLEDGQYVVELYCCDENGGTAYWTGILYLNNSEAVRVRIVADKYKVWLEAEGDVVMSGAYNVWLEDDIAIHVSFLEYKGDAVMSNGHTIWLEDDIKVEIIFLDYVGRG